MSNITRFEENRPSNSRSASKTNKLLLNSFYTLKVFKKIYYGKAIAQPGEAHSETFINLVKMSLAIAIASRKNGCQFRIEAGGL
jgi:hypothetical protein